MIAKRHAAVSYTHLDVYKRQDIAFGLKLACVERHASGCLGPERGGMVNIVGTEAGGFDFFHGQILGKLIDNGADHFKMGELFRPNIRQKPRHLPIGHGIALG